MSLSTRQPANPVTLSSDSETVLPCPFTPFERLKVLDDRVDYPMTILVEMIFAGELQEPAFREAVTAALANHPLLAARLEWRGRWPWWAARSEQPVPIEWHAAKPLMSWPRPPKIDLQRGPGIRFVVHASAERSSILLQMHHACADGQGSRRFMYDFFCHYERLVLGEASQRTTAKFDELMQQRLAKRAEVAASREVEEESEQGTTFSERLRNTLWFFTKRPTPLALPQRKRQSPEENRVQHVVFEIEETTRLRARALAENATFNDVALALLMRVAAEWNREYQASSEQSQVRIIMPTDLRQKDDDRSPAANRMGYAFPTRAMADTRDWRKLLASVHEETEYIKDRRLGADFVANITLAQAVPGLLPMYLRFTRTLATATLTNLGDVTRRLRRRFPQNAAGLSLVGGLPLVSVAGAPPVRPGTHAGFGLCVCGGRLTVSLMTDPFGFSFTDTQTLLQRYVSAIRSWLQGNES
jgi:hypothetical protein